MTSYAAQKGRSLPQSQAAPAPAAKPLTTADEAAIEANKAFILEHMPEMLPIIRHLHAEGLIDGWRAVKRCVLLDETGNE